MGRLVIINDKNQVLKTYDKNVTVQDIDFLLQDYERLLNNETDINKIVRQNEIKLNALFQQFQEKKTERFLRNQFTSFIDEYLEKQKVANRFAEYKKNKKDVIFSTFRVWSLGILKKLTPKFGAK